MQLQLFNCDAIRNEGYPKKKRITTTIIHTT